MLKFDCNNYFKMRKYNSMQKKSKFMLGSISKFFVKIVFTVFIEILARNSKIVI